MTWDRDPLWAKAHLFFERAFAEPRDDPMFGLWCSLGLELLARSALASVSPTLLAEPDRDHKYLLHALSRGSDRVPRRSIGAVQVLTLSRTLFDAFSEDDLKASLALVNRRNDELHSGAAAFEEYQPRQWLAAFYRACRSLAESMGESLETLFGEDEANAATEILDDIRNQVKQRTLNEIAAHSRVFGGKPAEERNTLAAEAEAEADRLASQRHHRVTCPACQSIASVQGRPFGSEHVTLGDGCITVRRAVSPRSFSCSACSLKLHGYAQLDAAQLGGQYTRTTEYTPEDYYGLLDPGSSKFEEYVAELYQEYDNE